MPRTKIVCTIGPASRSPKILKKLIQRGMNVARLNFSHGIQSEHLEVIERIRSIAVKSGKPVAIPQDLAGPKIRIGKIKAGIITLESGALFTLTNQQNFGLEVSVDLFRFSSH